MRASIRQLMSSLAVAVLVLTPLSAGAVLLTADVAVAKAKNVKATGKDHSKAKMKTAKKSQDHTRKTSFKPETHTPATTRDRIEPQTGTKAGRIDGAGNQVTLLDGATNGEAAGPTIGNPGNDKEVGRAGETPNGDENGWGEGERGRSDAEEAHSPKPIDVSDLLIPFMEL